MDAYYYLQQAIINGNLQPGQRITEVMLAEQLQMSRTPIRKALQQLEFDGLITPLTKGYVVSSFSKQDIVHLYDLRALLEGYAAFEAARYRTDEHLQVMYVANGQFYESVQKNIAQPSAQNVEQIVQSNKQFHDVLFDACNNPHLLKHTKQVVILPLMYRSFLLYDRFQLQRSVNAHEDLYNAISEQHPERAKVAAQNHVYQALQHILDNLKGEN